MTTHPAGTGSTGDDPLRAGRQRPGMLPRPHPQPPTYEQLAAALVTAAEDATWPDGSRVVDVDPTVLRTRLLPHLAAALAVLAPEGLDAASTPAADATIHLTDLGDQPCLSRTPEPPL